ncbi:MAG: agmatine deiminase family protein [Planctomycetia bacterium]|nr:agmatine deiminase family protein [Planctomycetia bacterium]
MSSMKSEPPAALGYRVPAEWEPHVATWLSWPHNLDTWPGQFEPIPAVFAELVRTLAAFEPVRILAGRPHVFDQARALVGDVAGVTIYDIATNDSWTRDHGPMFLTGPKGLPPALIDWGYNAWGGKYPPFDLDDQVPSKIADMLGMRRFEPGIILEGGAIDTNGRGTVLTTEQCLLNPNRNPRLSRGDVERYLADYGVGRHVVWLGEGIAGDDTDGHIDELARFVGPRTVVAAVEPDTADENHRALADNLARLSRALDQEGRPLEVVRLEMPRAVYYEDRRLPASYLNFYVAGGVVIVPQFDCPQDAAALNTLARLFPGRQARGLRAVELAWGLGTFHCITQQQPRATEGS